MTKIGIYRIFDREGREYVGSSEDLPRRRREHFNSLRNGTHKNILLQRAFDKYGEEFLDFEILLLCEKSRLNDYEQTVLDNVKTHYNISKNVGAPMRGRKHSTETRQKMSKSHWSRNPDAWKVKKRLKEANLGRKHSTRTREKLRQINKDRGSWGNHSEEAKHKLSEMNMGAKSPRARRVGQICLETGLLIREYSYMKEVEEYGFNYNSVWRVCKGRRKTHKGFAWKYLDCDD